MNAYLLKIAVISYFLAFPANSSDYKANKKHFTCDTRSQSLKDNSSMSLDSSSESIGNLALNSSPPTHSKQDIPKHVAIILDGNRRWATGNKLSPSAGHEQCFTRTCPIIVEEAFNLGIGTLTLWFFSSDNWKRSETEIGNLMKYCEDFILTMMEKAPHLGFQVIHIGRKDRIPKSLSAKISQCERETKKFKGRILNVAIDYGGKDEIVRVIKKLHTDGFDMNKLTEQDISLNLDTGSQPFPNPDLIIRTSPIDNRLSGFLTWQSQYSEVYLAQSFAPEFKRSDLMDAVEFFQKKNRTFSK